LTNRKSDVIFINDELYGNETLSDGEAITAN